MSSVRLLCVALAMPLMLLTPLVSEASSISVSPTCGTNQTHFLVSAGGFQTLSPCDSCTSTIFLEIDGADAYNVSKYPGCLSDLGTVDIRELEDGCHGCYLGPGPHTVRARTASDCIRPDGTVENPDWGCVEATYTVTDSAADPWANDLQFLTDIHGGDSVVVIFDPDKCELPDCQAVYLIQTSRLRAISGLDTTCVPITKDAFRGYGEDELEKMRETQIADCTRIDAGPFDVDPYFNGPVDHDDTGHLGRNRSNATVSLTWDQPAIATTAIPDSVLDEFEVNAYCGTGKNRGRYLGKTFWIYKITPAGAVALRDPRRGHDLGEPSSSFFTADTLWRRKRGFHFPKPAPPSKGGVPCQ